MMPTQDLDSGDRKLFNRGLSDGFLYNLKQGVLRPLVEAVKATELDLQD